MVSIDLTLVALLITILVLLFLVLLPCQTSLSLKLGLPRAAPQTRVWRTGAVIKKE